MVRRKKAEVKIKQLFHPDKEGKANLDSARRNLRFCRSKLFLYLLPLAEVFKKTFVFQLPRSQREKLTFLIHDDFIQLF